MILRQEPKQPTLQTLIFRGGGKAYRTLEGGGSRMAKPGRFGSLAFAMKNRHFRGECSWILEGKARKRGKFWVFACVPNTGKHKCKETKHEKIAKLSRFYYRGKNLGHSG